MTWGDLHVLITLRGMGTLSKNMNYLGGWEWEKRKRNPPFMAWKKVHNPSSRTDEVL